jgi:hypothetical protein
VFQRVLWLIGERFYICTSQQPGSTRRFRKLGVEPGDLPTGVIFGTAVITHCTRRGARTAGISPT